MEEVCNVTQRKGVAAPMGNGPAYSPFHFIFRTAALPPRFGAGKSFFGGRIHASSQFELKILEMSIFLPEGQISSRISKTFEKLLYVKG